MPTPAKAFTSTPDAGAGNPIDVVTIDRGAGVVDGQTIVLADPTNGTRYALISAGGAQLVDGSAVTQPVSGPLTDAQLRATPVPVSAAVAAPAFTRLSDGAAALIGQKTMAASIPVTMASDQLQYKVTIHDFPNQAGQKIMGTSFPVVLASDHSVFPAQAEVRAATLHVTGTAAVNTALTITLPAAGVGLFHYITSIQWVKLYSVVGVANAAGVLITSTNLPGNPIWTTEQAVGAAGTAPMVINYQPTTPLKCTAANTNTTIVAPLQLQTIWRGNVSYFTGA